ncbi:MAG: hydrogenase formation protein HypD [Methanomicrobiales archaeon]|nr:hydrogenase formation protein HypD [Methanomicrobiales archaeon]
MGIEREISEQLHALVDRPMNFMHVCGTHEASIARSGLRSVLPPMMKIVMGPGCPVCITPAGEIDAALELAADGVTIATYGDLMRVPGSQESLESCGGDVRIVQGIHKAVEIAGRVKNEVVFVSVGFETTAPTVAAAIRAEPPKNFSILSYHRLVPPAMEWLLTQGEAKLHGFILPGHVCTVSGYHEYERFPVPQVVAGFEPEEILLGFLMLAQIVRQGEVGVRNAYPKAVSRDGNVKAMALMHRVFEPCDVEWRGFPVIPASGLRLRDEFGEYDALRKFGIAIKKVTKKTACICDRVLRGIADPSDCPLFGRACTPARPIGPCMVSHEGACRIWHTYHVGGRK